jgi:hypothetical protein
LRKRVFFYSDGIKSAAFALAEVRRTRNAIKINCDGFVGLLLIKVGSCRDKNFGLKYLRLVEFAVVNPRFFDNYVFAKHVNVQDVQERKYKIKTASVG